VLKIARPVFEVMSIGLDLILVRSATI